MDMGVPYITIEGRRGGSPLAVSVVHALCELALRSWSPRSREIVIFALLWQSSPLWRSPAVLVDFQMIQ